VTALRATRAAALATLALAACAAPGAWDGSVGRWGSVREVMRDGDSRARVEVADVVATRQALGVGVLAGLAGEVTVLDGDVWVTRAGPDGRLETERSDGTGVEAALLALARVERWVSVPLPPDAGRAGLEAAVVAAVERAGLAGAETLPFEIRGELAGLEAHVVRGACPLAPGADPRSPDAPLRIRRARARGTLVGFLTRLPPGELTHHGRRAHVHVLLEDGPTAHVDRVEVASTAVLLLPDPSR
jgi:hypothetical protein